KKINGNSVYKVTARYQKQGQLDVLVKIHLLEHSVYISGQQIDERIKTDHIPMLDINQKSGGKPYDHSFSRLAHEAERSCCDQHQVRLYICDGKRRKDCTLHNIYGQHNDCRDHGAPRLEHFHKNLSYSVCPSPVSSAFVVVITRTS